MSKTEQITLKILAGVLLVAILYFANQCAKANEREDMASAPSAQEEWKP